MTTANARPAGNRGRVLRAIERGLMALAFACLAWSGFVAVEARRYQHDEAAALERMLALVPPVNAPAAVSAPLRPGDLIGSLTIPRLHLSAMVVEGDDDGSLSVAIGHLPDTPPPWWDHGNAAVAAHRDTYFRPLKDIVVGDEIEVVTPRGQFVYDVTDTTIVGPDDTSVLNPTENPTLTLITCYPFGYIGHAPRRFIVRAERRTLVP
jgi:sortase A